MNGELSKKRHHHKGMCQFERVLAGHGEKTCRGFVPMVCVNAYASPPGLHIEHVDAGETRGLAMLCM